VHDLKANRPDLAGLPFLLSPRCKLPAQQAVVLQSASQSIRTLLGARPRDPYHIPDAAQFWSKVHSQSWSAGGTPVGSIIDRHRPSLPAFVQLLQGEDGSFRHGLVGVLHETKEKQASEPLARLALYDPDSDIRALAFEAILHRSKEDVSQV